MEVDVRVVCQDFRNFLDRLDGPDFVIDAHNGDQGRILVQGRFQVFRINPAFLVNWQAGNPEAQVFQFGKSISH